jgi:hypothetical protein
MPPRYAYWTILVDNQPTAFRAAMQEDLMPTFKRLKEKHPSAEMKWFQNGKLWASRDEAHEAMQNRGERGRMGDQRQGGGFRDRKRNVGENFRSPEGEREKPREPGEKLEWKPKGEFTPAPKRERSSRPQDFKTSRPERPEWKTSRPERRPEWKTSRPQGFEPSKPPRRASGEKLEWKPKGEFTPAPKRDRSSRPQDFKTSRPEGRQDSRTSRPEGRREWKPKGTFDRDRKPAWKPKGEFTPAPKRDRSSRPQDSRWKSERPKWTPKAERTSGSRPAPGSPEKRKWIPKEEYKKSKGIEAPRDSKWRPGGEHRDPRQKYKDAKKAKWQGFKKKIRTRWEGKQTKKRPKE